MSDSNSTNDPYEPAPPTAPDGVAFHEPVRVAGHRSTTARAGLVAGSALLVAIGVIAAMGASPARRRPPTRRPRAPARVRRHLPRLRRSLLRLR